VDGGIDGELGDRCFELALRCRGGELHLFGLQPSQRGLPMLHADVHLTGFVIPDEHRREHHLRGPGRVDLSAHRHHDLVAQCGPVHHDRRGHAGSVVGRESRRPASLSLYRVAFEPF
jgi:hypothetical protein